MHILNFFVIPIVLISLIYARIRFSYLIALIVSLTGATFVYAEQNLANIVFTIAIFNLTPWACLQFNEKLQKYRISQKQRQAAEKQAYQQMLKERSLIRQSNSRLDNEVFQIAELYRMTRDMSAVLQVEEIFDILGKKLLEHFQFKKCRLCLIDEQRQTMEIKQVFELTSDEAYPRQVNVQTEDEEILKQSLSAARPRLIEAKSITLAPLTTDSKLLGTLAVEGLSAELLEKFSILANQFSLELKRIRLYQKIQQLAITDGLTGLFVRRYFLERLQEEIQRCNRHHLSLGFLMIDIDRFKQCNDNFGHLTGDVVLKEVAREIRVCVREIDLVARFGGEEFSVLLPNTDKVGARDVAERIRSTIDRHKCYAYDKAVKTEVSIGVAGFPGDSTTLQELIDKADQALYRAKQEGRNKVCIFH